MTKAVIKIKEVVVLVVQTKVAPKRPKSKKQQAVEAAKREAKSSRPYDLLEYFMIVFFINKKFYKFIIINKYGCYFIVGLLFMYT